MHPSVYVADPEHQKRRSTARKRERRASCSSTTPTLTYQIPSLRKIERRSSFSTASTGSTHSRHERRSSCSSIASLSDSYSSNTSSSSTKSCTFRDDAEVIHVPAATTLTGESLWYQKEDFENFRKKTQRIINNVDKNGRGKNGKKYCTRGLEKYMARAQESRENRRKSILAALDEDESASSKTDKKLESAETDSKREGSFRKMRMILSRRKPNE
mmetsp:Transcript_4175/g.9917  ORF Transcript_4175/g.9917 Transcript_4175/m.9917 type:complete len:215 (+) Transcript_4175:167-811(+)|eukprot:CAMPEP_0116083766 /NCGR_PEP_ID=MMETSP0327-20121206/3450_1 /TAXON_ID=44447 /ORGANISM="Pseudo-nitzschia delicatissima, Strain B596" /LENGTH=214 /DNA_ID=CAMNT_0003574679 /DNA_START=71 /DNA_END=715 /DNA_ORIENTATION=-